ncbi:PaaI family thioesterase [Nocardioides marmotae]|uniref:Hotdog fold thioesterase n=1 Tax=Nocardioides marmotae TaxID=2663857 RepID=A0A6I3JE10_9ACTN|nr:PaaI family thioesterase [Nocardioides marmotae]MCR6032698.1 hotdog fold thioesterase [Gordonia jinghuaiqii]MBC9732455.1 PaaI family thioesterase [Nocardioides marmotae]MTB83574.1 hotdog fold thioesterase [Nocardioides marmotae]MTB96347.1 hotdog fold thioesterase [Nocardioides marmotae]QKE03169.1 PaaI family thioesterase [Nocardioides marmotae]
MTDEPQGFLSLIGARAPDATDGRATLVVDVGEEHLNHAGAVHGGMLATLVDTAMGAAIMSTLDEGSTATSQLTVTYLRPGKPGQLVVTAAVGKRGQSLTVCDAEIEQDGETLVHALATFALLDG